MATTRFNLEFAFASKKSKNDKSWGDVLTLLTAMAAKGEFPKSDLRKGLDGGIERLKRKWSKMESRHAPWVDLG